MCEISADGAHSPIYDQEMQKIQCLRCGVVVTGDEIVLLACAALVFPPHMAEENARMAEDWGWLLQEERNRRYKRMWERVADGV